MSSATKTDTLPMMTRSAYDKSEAKLTKQGLSLENVVDTTRLSVKPKGGTCAAYPNNVQVNVLGVIYNVPYDNAHNYACFDSYKYGGANEVTIGYTGARSTDYIAANTAAGHVATPVGYTWHHFENYNAGNNQGTMQLVNTNIHAGVAHLGGVWQWGLANPGMVYGV